ncbi:MAG TPA: DUF2934 domain-containing protein [Mycoplana sp.]|nr:DUF2934 domain-containing protein [Mycoplana sp.]
MSSGNGTDRDEEIRRRAHGIWESEGRQDGSHERHWLQAQHEIEEEKREKAASAKPRKSERSRGGAPGNTGQNA